MKTWQLFVSLQIIFWACALKPIDQEILNSPKSPITVELQRVAHDDQVHELFQKANPNPSSISASLIQMSNQSSLNLTGQEDTSKLIIEKTQMLCYYGNIALGSYSSNYGMIFDTGSFYLIVDSVLCKDPMTCERHKQYDSHKSMSFTDARDPVDFIWHYGSASVRARRGFETLYVSKYEISNFEFYQVVEEENLLNYEGIDGIIGLAKINTEISPRPQYTVMDVLYDEGLIDQNVFTFDMKRKENSISLMTIGGYSLSDLGSPINWMKVIHPKYWLVKMDKFYFGEENNNICNNDCAVMLDTGTTLIGAPKDKLEIVRSFMSKYTCGDIEKLPNLVFVLNGEKYELTPHEYLIGIKDNKIYYYEQPKSLDNCGGIFLPLDIIFDQHSVFILGNIFLSKFVSIFDKDQNRIGLAHQA